MTALKTGPASDLTVTVDNLTGFDAKNKTIPAPAPVHYLLIHSDANFCIAAETSAKSMGVTLSVVPSLAAYPGSDRIERYDALLLDYDHESSTDFAAAHILSLRAPNAPIIMLTSNPQPQLQPPILSHVIGLVSMDCGPGELMKQVHEMFQSGYVAWVMGA